MQLKQPPVEYMGTPQTEDGFTRIANELLEAIISFPFTKRETVILLSVIRKTYGFNKKHDAVSMWQLAAMSGLDRAHVSRCVKDLMLRNILTDGNDSRVSRGVEIKSLGLNKNYSQWLTVAKSAPLPNQHRCQNSTVAKTAF